jgi:hypothetical protein
MFRSILRWCLFGLAAAMIFVGIVPLTPMIWLLVILRVNVDLPVRLEFWQTQTLGLLLTAGGIALIMVLRRRPIR